MLTTTFKKVSQATAVTAIGIAMLASVGNAPAHAVNLRTYDISGKFATKALNGSTGIAVDLENGTFEGTYTLDLDLFLANPGNDVALENWLIKLKNTSNTVLKTFSSNIPGHTGLVLDNSLLFTNNIASTTGGETASLGLLLKPGFTTSTSNSPYDGLFTSNVYKIVTILKPKKSTFKTVVAGEIPIQPVPEPVSTSGIAVAGAMGLWMKRKQKASVA